MKIIPLGTNGFFSSFGRQTACYAIPLKNTLIILDAGSGLFRLAEAEGKKLLGGIDEIHLFLSHYHLDHTIGFYAAFKLFEGKKVRVFAQSGRQIFWEFVATKQFPVDYSKVHRNFKWEVIDEGMHKISSYKVLVRKQYHRGEGSLAFRFSFSNYAGKELAYVTDSELTRESISFVKNVPFLLHEHTLSGEIRSREASKVSIEKKEGDKFHYSNIYYYSEGEGHVTTAGAAMIAKKAKVGKLVLIHHNPFADEEQLEKQLGLARSIFPRTELARDLKEVDLFYGSVERF